MAEWLSRWPRDPRSITVGKPASEPLARRGSNPFPGAINMELDKSTASDDFLTTGSAQSSCCSPAHLNNNF